MYNDGFKGNPSRWKYGHAKYGFHTPLEYKILKKGTDPNIDHWHISPTEILIEPISIGHGKSKMHMLLSKEKGLQTIDITHYSFWIPRRRIRRGPQSWSQKKDRWVHKKTFNQCLARAIKGKIHFVEPYYYL